MFVPLLIGVLISPVFAQSGHPEFDPPMEKVVLEEGTQANVECVAKGERPLTYTWYNQKDAEITTDSKRGIFVQHLETGSSLHFAEVKLSHAGLYSCSATNRHGTASKPYDIIVNTTSGNITTNETAEIVNVVLVSIAADSVEFDVQTKGNPDSFFIRFREKLGKEEYYRQIKRGEKAVVKYLVPSGSYEFHFQIEHPLLVKRSVHNYYITLLPDIPDVIFRSIKDGFVQVEWFRSIDDLSRGTIQEYELSYNIVRVTGGKTWNPSNCAITIRVPLADCPAAGYTIAGLQPDTYYEIRMRLRTDTGYGRAYANKVHTL